MSVFAAPSSERIADAHVDATADTALVLTADPGKIATLATAIPSTPCWVHQSFIRTFEGHDASAASGARLVCQRLNDFVRQPLRHSVPMDPPDQLVVQVGVPGIPLL
jgi:hypothetical protein